MKKAKVFVSGVLAGELTEIIKEKSYQFVYLDSYEGEPVSLTMPTHQRIYSFHTFPPFFANLLAEGPILNALLKKRKLDRNDCFEQLMVVGKELSGNVTVERAL